MTVLDAFTRSYLRTALWSSTDDEGEPLDDNYGIADIDPLTVAQAQRDCDLFRLEVGTVVDSELGGHDFWLTRNGHGAGFWDGDWENGDYLTEVSKRFGTVDLYVGDDGKVYGS